MLQLRFTPLAIAVWLFTGSPAGALCVGDCDGSGSVTVNELIEGVRISLGDAAVDACPAFDAVPDGSVSIDELVLAVTGTLSGCPATPAPSATPTLPPATATPSPTSSPSATATPIDTPTASDTPTITPTPSPSDTPSPTPTVPAVSGDWREDPLTVTASSCFPVLTSEFAAELAARPPCTQHVTATSDATVSVVDCTSAQVDGTLERDGTLRLVYPRQTDTVEGCSVTLDTSAVVPAASSPTTAQYRFQVSFSGACPLANCIMDASGSWTRL